jgi:hypothetical protein
MAEIIGLKRKIRPLTATYEPMAPYIVERVDDDDGQIIFEVRDKRPDSFRCVCSTSDFGGNGYAKHDVEQVARALNMLVQFGKETLPVVKDVDEQVADNLDDEDEL